MILRSFVAGVLTDDRVPPRPDALQMLAALSPGDAGIQARLARAEFESPERNLPAAQDHARRACDLSPWNFQYRSLLASIEDAAGHQQQAEEAITAAVRLAPNNSEVQWKMANILLRGGKLQQAAPHFQAACSSNDELLGLVIDTLWQASGGDAKLLAASIPTGAGSQLTLANYLLGKSQVTQAVQIFERLPNRDKLAAPMLSGFIGGVAGLGQPALARRLWAEVAGLDPNNLPDISNGGFESPIRTTFPEFDWRISSNKYADVSVDTRTARTGSRSLRVTFKGIDTTSLNREITQLIVVQAGLAYRLRCYVKAEGVESPEGPRLVITDPTTGAALASSNPIKPGTYGWTPLDLDFIAPSGAASGSVTKAQDDGSGPDAQLTQNSIAVLLSLKRTPRFSYDDPTKGTIWLDDFELQKAEAGGVGKLER
ncbi:MAG TPA: tetratricopeptide repeat protein [Blastocatellia bacterium]|nr:tetratricopeptide repeat protein [Blastocatellia bacterium]